jgi:hypothetical protein
MSDESLLLLWSEAAAVSLLVWAALGLLALYLARVPAHRLIESATRWIARLLRQAARQLARVARRAGAHNREVLLAIAEENEGRYIERELRRVSALVERDLAEYPSLHRALSEQLAELEADYQRSAEAPPTAPAWTEGLEVLARLESRVEPGTVQLLQGMREAIERASREAVDEYRGSSRKRHYWLHRMRPRWRSLHRLLQGLDVTLRDVQARSRSLDRHMTRYETIRKGADPMVRSLQASALSRLAVSAMALAVAAFVVGLNFSLIGGVMSTTLGTEREFWPGLGLGQAATAAIVFASLAAAVMFTEALRVTRLFPGIAELEDVRRGALMVLTLGLLLLLAGGQAAIAYLAQAGSAAEWVEGAEEVTGSGVGAYAALMLGLALPLSYLPVGIALESFVQSLRVVLGRLAAMALGLAAGSLRLLARFCEATGELLRRCYDVIVFLPLALERLVRRGRSASAGPAAQVHADGE